MIGPVLYTLTVLIYQAYGQECIKDSASYAIHLENLLSGLETTHKNVCSDVSLMTRVQSLYPEEKWPRDPESLDQYGRYWTFASGTDVANEFLKMAEKYRERRKDYVRQVLYYVGFGNSSIYLDGSTEYKMLVFDQDKLDEHWLLGEPDGKFPYQSFQPKWYKMFEYLETKFQVCHNPLASPGPDQNTVTEAEHCTNRTVDIPEQARTQIATELYTEVTGCKDGYPGVPDHRRESREECEKRCPPSNSNYCVATQILHTASYQGSVACIDSYNNDRPVEVDEVLWARAFFESCLSFNQWFTGKGVGYNPQDKEETGSEFLVRGDLHLDKLASSPVYLWEFDF